MSSAYKAYTAGPWESDDDLVRLDGFKLFTGSLAFIEVFDFGTPTLDGLTLHRHPEGFRPASVQRGETMRRRHGGYVVTTGGGRTGGQLVRGGVEP